MTLAVFLLSLFSALALGMPVAFALIICGLALMALVGTADAQIVAGNMINGLDNFIFIAVPFFMLAGELMNAGGLSQRIVRLGLALVGHKRGGLGYVAILASVILASLSGSAIADAAAISAILLPMMRIGGYDANRSAGLIAASSIIAPVIPPSIGFVMIGAIGGISITKLFMAGIVPGLMMAISLMVVWWWLNRNNNTMDVKRATGREVVRAVVEGGWALMLPVIIIGGMKFGVFTPTEAAVVAVAYSLFVGVLVYRELTLAKIYHCLVLSAKTTTVVMFVVASAFVSSWMITTADVPQQVVGLLGPFMDSPTTLMLLIAAMLVVMGMALDFTPMILILIPVLVPVITQAGVDPVFFGVIFLMCNAIGLITWPVGTVLNVVCGTGRLSFAQVSKAVVPFILAEVCVVLLLVFFPQLVMAPMHFLTR
ncbi:MAG: TRAP transporter large permease subunit [Betaproteobacteria bacterium]|jgi:tripartite ATP-independent transporter DctM subunit|nr:TRAP transporter large permease subunit [Betaproteobacteria bacterium]